MVLAFGVQMVVIDILRYFKVPAPIRISSLPRGSHLRPGIYSIIEDVCAVDGSGGTEFRQRLSLRYAASHYFRQMLHRLTLFWAFGALAIGSGTTVVVFVVDSKDAAYVVSIYPFNFFYILSGPLSSNHANESQAGWTMPFVWAGIWAFLTVIYVKKSLKKEKEVWATERAKA